MAEGEVKGKGRGALCRVIERTILNKGRRQRCVLECGHVVVRSAGQRSERCYCIECGRRTEKLSRGMHRYEPPVVGGTGNETDDDDDDDDDDEK
jgi:hypothetical protein